MTGSSVQFQIAKDMRWFDTNAPIHSQAVGSFQWLPLVACGAACTTKQGCQFAIIRGEGNSTVVDVPSY